MLTIAHLSDLHIGRSPERSRVARLLRDRLLAIGANLLLVTGDCTEHGSVAEHREFTEIFTPFLEEGRLLIVPGNHDRTGHEIGKYFLGNERLRVHSQPGLHLILVDSTGPHNRYRLLAHGKLDPSLLHDIETAVGQAPADSLVAVALHHHLIPQPEELWLEKVAAFFRTSIAAELQHGQELIRRLVGRCDLILHGHRHVPLETRFHHAMRPLTVFNAGSSTELGRFRLFTVHAGKLTAEPIWYA
jgi:3',5'-cyclic AMP phosphodiesterase CpdA